MTRKQRNSSTTREAGFSLVEMLVVMAIIAILVSLTAAAVFKVIGVQRANNTQTTLKSVSSLLDKQWAFGHWSSQERADSAIGDVARR